MNELITAVLLGIVEGVTEFLPISSTGHLLLAQRLFLKEQSELFNVVIQCGAVLAVLAVFSKRVKEMLTHFNEPETRDYILKVAVAFGMTCVGMLVLKKMGLTFPKKIEPIAWATLIGGVVIFLVERVYKGKTAPSDITWLIAITVGLAQILAGACPGTSRSGATILFAMMVGLSRPAATEFSFLVGIPTMFAAGAYEIHHELKHAVPGHHEDWAMVAVGTIVSAIVAFIVVKWLLRYVQSHTFTGFAWYRVILGGFLLVAIAKHWLA